MPKGQPSQADVDLANQLHDRGVTVRGQAITAGQIQGWRTVGLIAQVVVTYVGRRGRTSQYPPHAIDDAIATARLIDHRRSIDHALIGAFGAGRNPKYDSLIAAFTKVIGEWRTDIRRHDAAIDDPRDLSRLTYQFTAMLGEMMTPTCYDAWKSEMRERRHSANIAQAETFGTDTCRKLTRTPGIDWETAHSMKASVIAQVTTLMQGQAQAGEVLEAAGIAPVLRTLLGATPQEFDSATDFTVDLGPGMLQRLKAHTPESLIEKRDAALTLYSALNPILPIVSGWVGLTPIKCDICARTIFAIVMTQLPSLQELASKLEPAEIANLFECLTRQLN